MYTFLNVCLSLIVLAHCKFSLHPSIYWIFSHEGLTLPLAEHPVLETFSTCLLESRVSPVLIISSIVRLSFPSSFTLLKIKLQFFRSFFRFSSSTSGYTLTMSFTSATTLFSIVFTKWFSDYLKFCICILTALTDHIKLSISSWSPWQHFFSFLPYHHPSCFAENPF